jgi:uncharacterized membrane protein YdcZ (DUF606 family)
MSTSTAAESAPAVDPDDQPARVSRRQRRRDGTVGRGISTGAGVLARIVHFVVGIIVLIIVAGILFVLLKADPTNTIVHHVHSWARSLAGPFDGIFSFRNARTAVAVNWGIAVVVYLFVAGLITRLLGRTYR